MFTKISQQNFYTPSPNNIILLFFCFLSTRIFFQTHVLELISTTCHTVQHFSYTVNFYPNTRSQLNRFVSEFTEDTIVLLKSKRTVQHLRGFLFIRCDSGLRRAGRRINTIRKPSTAENAPRTRREFIRFEQTVASCANGVPVRNERSHRRKPSSAVAAARRGQQ